MADSAAKQRPKRPEKNVAVIGAGAAGLIAAAEMLRRADAKDPFRLTVDILAPGGKDAAGGLAYGSATDANARLNIPAYTLTADPRKPTGLQDYLREKKLPTGPAAAVSRHDLRRYLLHELEAARAGIPRSVARVRWGDAAVVSITPGKTAGTSRVNWHRGEEVLSVGADYDAVILATGHLPRPVPAFASGVERQPFVRLDPYDPAPRRSFVDMVDYGRRTGLPVAIVGSGTAGVGLANRLLASRGQCERARYPGTPDVIKMFSPSGTLPAVYQDGRALHDLPSMEDRPEVFRLSAYGMAARIAEATATLLRRIEHYQEGHPDIDPQRIREGYLHHNRLRLVEQAGVGDRANGAGTDTWVAALSARAIAGKRVGIVPEAIQPLVDAGTDPSIDFRVNQGRVTSITVQTDARTGNTYFKLRVAGPEGGVEDVLAAAVCSAVPNPNDYRRLSELSGGPVALWTQLLSAGLARLDATGRPEVSETGQLRRRAGARDGRGRRYTTTLLVAGVAAQGVATRALESGTFRLNLYQCLTTGVTAAANALHAVRGGDIAITGFRMGQHGATEIALDEPAILPESLAPPPKARTKRPAPDGQANGRRARRRLLTEAPPPDNSASWCALS